MPAKIVVGNWKMNGLQGSLNELIDISVAAKHLNCTTVICPPATLVWAAAQTQDIISVGGQDCHDKAIGAYTGEISAGMLADSGAKYVIVGHSERRSEYGETNSLVKRKATVAQASNLTPIICVGETLDERKAGRAIEIVLRDLTASVPGVSDFIVAYEPIWAIGTGLIPSIHDITEIHDALRNLLTDRFNLAGEKISLLYGGSVKSSNATEIFACINVNGALVGGASLTARDFIPIMHSLSNS